MVLVELVVGAMFWICALLAATRPLPPSPPPPPPPPPALPQEVLSHIGDCAIGVYSIWDQQHAKQLQLQEQQDVKQLQEQQDVKQVQQLKKQLQIEALGVTCAASLSLGSISSMPPESPPPPPLVLQAVGLVILKFCLSMKLLEVELGDCVQGMQHIKQLLYAQRMRQEAEGTWNLVLQSLNLVLRVVETAIPMFLSFRFFKGGRRGRRHLRELGANFVRRVQRSPSLRFEERMAAFSRRPITVSPEDSDHSSDFDGSSSSSSISEISWSSWILVYPTEGCCFLPDTVFEVQRDNGERILMRAGQLCAGTRVLAANEQWVEVRNPPEQHAAAEVIELAAGNASLTVSPEHRVVIPGGQSVQAKELDVGRKVLLMGGIEATLTSFIRRREPTTVLKIAFKPDYPVCAFTLLEGILTRGYRSKPLRRSLRRGSEASGVDNVSMPATEPQITP